jgi:tungstate transport system substrate-binding protein
MTPIVIWQKGYITMGWRILLLRMILTLLTVALILPPLAAAQANPNIILATTTSTQDSGLLDVLLPAFEQKTGYRVKTIAVGTGKALAMGQRGDADVLLTHAPEAEQPLVEEGTVVERVPFMYNDFVVLGPAADPAKVQTAQTAAEALRRIAESKASFISRGDQSGTHQKEQSLWKASHLDPKGDWYIEAGQGMGATLRIASEKHAYTLTDRSTYLHLQKTLASAILFAGDPVLRNVYSVMRVNPAKHSGVNTEGGKALHAWLLGEEARELIRHYGVEQFGQPLFFLEKSS